jgi:hypothetical protein
MLRLTGPGFQLIARRIAWSTLMPIPAPLVTGCAISGWRISWKAPLPSSVVGA